MVQFIASICSSLLLLGLLFLLATMVRADWPKIVLALRGRHVPARQAIAKVRVRRRAPARLLPQAVPQRQRAAA